MLSEAGQNTVRKYGSLKWGNVVQGVTKLAIDWRIGTIIRVPVKNQNVVRVGREKSNLLRGFPAPHTHIPHTQRLHNSVE